ncbi:MAG: ABC transporter ATP-binding protein [Lachnospirales bacterium]
MARNVYNVDETLRQEFNFKHLKRLFGYLKPHRKQLIFALFLMLLASAANIIIPLLVKETIDRVIPERDVQKLVILCAIFAVLILVSAICLKKRIKVVNELGQTIILTMRKDLFVHLQKLPFSFYDDRPHGKIIVRVVNYVNSVSDLLSGSLVNVLAEGFSLIIVLFIMFFMDPVLTLVCLVAMPIMIFVVFRLKTWNRVAWQRVSNKSSNLNAYVHESLAGMKVTQSFVREDYNAQILDDVQDDYRKTWMRAIRLNNLVTPSIEIISTLANGAVILVGIALLEHSVTAGTLIAFLGFTGRLWSPVINLSNFYNQVITNMAYLERIFETIDEDPRIQDAPDAVDLPPIEGEVEFDHVTFEYEPGMPILEDLSFRVDPGQSIALVGPTGAGKTTVINLISRFYDIQKGQIRVDGYDIAKVTLQSLRKQMGVMLQDSFIFSGTIMDNIRYGKLDATDEEVIEAAKTVCAHEFIMEMERGYQTQVNERGSRLSVGQRQLISFARALLANPKILILDEATSSIDTRTEQALQKGLENLLKGRTSFVIAHRLSTIRKSDRIMVINHRNIEEAGTHEELMAKKGHYYTLYTTQTRFIS